jgi:hypothetical protein
MLQGILPREGFIHVDGGRRETWIQHVTGKAHEQTEKHLVESLMPVTFHVGAILRYDCWSSVPESSPDATAS